MVYFCGLVDFLVGAAGHTSINYFLFQSNGTILSNINLSPIAHPKFKTTTPTWI